MPDAFPDEQSLCEACGYPLRGVAFDVGCPECGEPVARSSPETRTGLAIQHSISPASALAVWAAIATRPRHAFRSMRTWGPMRNERLLMLFNCLVTALLFEAIRQTGWVQSPAWASALVGALSWLMMRLEAAGVWFFSRRRKWRVSWQLAERMICICSVGWLPMGMIAAGALGGFQHGWLDRPWFAAIEKAIPSALYFSAIFTYGAGILWFESLVGVGVRQVRFSNRPPSPEVTRKA